MSARRAALLLVGNELLGGKVHDTNLPALAVVLRRLGVPLVRAVLVPDERATIAAEVNALRSSHDVVFTSGGVGPTHDDVTLAAVADAFGVGLAPDPTVEQLVRSHFGPRTSEGHLAMALLPTSAELRSAPGSDWPAIVVGNVWVLPGLPEAFADKLKIVAHHLTAGPPIVSRAVYTWLDEGTLKPHLDATVAAFPDVDVGSYPTWSDPTYHVKLTFDGTDPARLGAALDDLVARLPADAVVRVD